MDKFDDVSENLNRSGFLSKDTEGYTEEYSFVSYERRNTHNIISNCLF